MESYMKPELSELSELPKQLDLPLPIAFNPLEEARNLILIACGWIFVLLLIPPQHEYPIIDDWIYAGSVRDMLNTGAFVMPPNSQASLVGLTAWGAAWSKALGFSFTTLTYSTLFFSFVALFAFYGILRLVKTPAWGAMLGVGLLAYNPLFVHLSYSFMTDVPFLALMFSACFFYLLAFRSIGRARWWFFVPAGLCAAWALLVRQFGLLIPAVFVGYLLLDSIVARKIRWRDMLGVVAIPALVAGVWYVWSLGIPTTPAAAAASGRAASFVFKESWPRFITIRVLVYLPVVAFFAWAALKLPRSRWRLAGIWAVLVALALNYTNRPDELLVQMYEASFSAHFGFFTIDFPQEAFTFGGIGNIVRVTGIDFFEYRHEWIWNQETWRLIWVVGLAIGVVLLAKLTGDLFDWLKERLRGVPLSPVIALYFLGAAIFTISTAFLGDAFDRYMFAVFPFVIVYIMRGSANWGRIAWTYSIVALGVLATFSLLAKADNVDHDNARWQAGYWLLARVSGANNGFDWNNWIGRNDNYTVTDIPYPDQRLEHSFPYFSRLGGFTTRYVYAQSQANMPPLPAPPGGQSP